MLKNASKLRDLELRARDGVLGKVKDFYFDDYRWTVRYLVVETGSWLNSRRVLIATSILLGADWEKSLLDVDLTQEQVRNSPGLDTERPVSRQDEEGLHAYYGWSAYWLAPGYAGGALAVGVPDVAGAPGPGAALPITDAPLVRSSPGGDPNLRSGRTVTGYHLEAVDGAIGHVDDYVVDDASWAIRYLIIDTRNWLPGRKVLVSPEWVSEVNWTQSRVYVDLPRERVKNAPEYDASRPIEPAYADSLHAHYDRPPFAR